MNNLIAVKVLDTEKKTSDEKFCLVFWESSFDNNVVPKVASIEVIHYQVEILFILEGVAHVD